MDRRFFERRPSLPQQNLQESKDLSYLEDQTCWPTTVIVRGQALLLSPYRMLLFYRYSNENQQSLTFLFAVDSFFLPE